MNDVFVFQIPKAACQNEKDEVDDGNTTKPKNSKMIKRKVNISNNSNGATGMSVVTSSIASKSSGTRIASQKPSIKNVNKDNSNSMQSPSTIRTSFTTSNAMKTPAQKAIVNSEKKIVSNQSTTNKYPLSKLKIANKFTNLSNTAIANKISSEALKKEVTSSVTNEKLTTRHELIENNISGDEGKFLGSDAEKQSEVEHKTKVESNSDTEYDDDFEDYESTFESYSESSDTSIGSMHNDNVPKKAIIEEEKKMDSGSYDLTRRKMYPIDDNNQLRIIQEALTRENEQFVEDRKLSTDEHKISLTESKSNISERFDNVFNITDDIMKDFKKITSKKALEKKKTRVEKLLDMIVLDEINYVFYDAAPVDYETFMRCSAPKNTKQSYMQTNEDNLNTDTQTEEIGFSNKWTQYPIEISKDVLLNICNENEYVQVLSGVGDESANYNVPSKYTTPIINTYNLIKFIKSFGEEMIAVLEENLNEQLMMKDDDRNINNNGDLNILNISQIKHQHIKCLQERLITSVVHDHYDSSRVMLIHQKNQTEKNSNNKLFAVLSIWSIYQPEKPIFLLKSFGHVTCATFVSSDSSFIIAGHADGSICVWNLRDQMIHSSNNDCLDDIFVLPSCTTAYASSASHKSSVMKIEGIIENGKFIDEKLLQTVFSIEEDNVLMMWTLAQNSRINSNLGMAPWSRTNFFLNQKIDIQSAIPSTMTIQSEYHALIGTNAGVTIRCSFVRNQYKTYSNGKIGELLSVTIIKLCPCDDKLFLVAYDNHEILIFNINFTKPVMEVKNDVEYYSCLTNKLCLDWMGDENNKILILKPPSTLEIWTIVLSEHILLKSVTLDTFEFAVIYPHSVSRHKNLNIALKTNDGVFIKTITQ